MRKALAVPIAAGAALLILPGVSAGSRASAQTYRLSASLNPHQVVTPRNHPWMVPASVAKARGSFTGTLTTSSSRRTLHWHISFAGVGSNPLRIADVHYGVPGKFGPLVVRLCGPCEAGQSGTKKLTASAAHSISVGATWITVITGAYPNGVIRGQIKVS